MNAMSPPSVLGELCEIASGGTPSRARSEFYGGGIPWAKISDLEAASDGALLATEETISAEGLQAIRGRIFPEGTLLFAIYGSIGKMAFAGRHVSCNQAILGIQNKSPRRLDMRYLFHWLASKKQSFLSDGQGIAQKNLSAGYLRDLRVPLPSLDEQRRIAAILDKAEALRQKRKRAISLLESLTQSIFIEMFGEREVRSEKRTVGELARKVTDGTHQAPNWAEEGVPFLFVSNVRNQKLDMRTDKHVSETEYRRLTKSTPIEAGDVLYTAVGSYGHAAVVPDGAKFVFQRHIAHIKPRREIVQPKFLSIALEMPDARRQADALARGNAQKTVPLSALKEIEVAVPSLDRQTIFVQRTAAIEDQVRTASHSLALLNNAFASLQHRAFSGQL